MDLIVVWLTYGFVEEIGYLNPNYIFGKVMTWNRFSFVAQKTTWLINYFTDSGGFIESSYLEAVENGNKTLIFSVFRYLQIPNFVSKIVKKLNCRWK